MVIHAGDIIHLLLQKHASEASRIETMVQMVIYGVSTRKVEKVVRTFCGTSFSKFTVCVYAAKVDWQWANLWQAIKLWWAKDAIAALLPPGSARKHSFGGSLSNRPWNMCKKNGTRWKIAQFFLKRVFLAGVYCFGMTKVLANQTCSLSYPKQIHCVNYYRTKLSSATVWT